MILFVVFACLSLAFADDPGTPNGSTPQEEQETQQAELAMKILNPVADLINVPFQNNWDFGIGATDATRFTMNIQPVIPFSLGEGWLVITRTIMPIISAESPIPGGETRSGLGDILQSFFFSPRAPVNGWTVGVGPVFSYPTATDDALGTEKFGMGPTAVVLKQKKGWTIGALVNHVWSVAGEESRPDISTTFLQPFLSYTTKKHMTFGLNTESTYDWEGEQWTVPLNASVSQLLKVGKLPLSLGVGVRPYLEKPEGGPDWGMRFVATFVFPK
jgi:hypothetical protein